MNFPFDNTKDLLCICLIVQHYNQTLFFFFLFSKINLLLKNKDGIDLH